MISMLLKIIIIIMIIILVKVDDNQYGDHNGGEFIHLWEAALCGGRTELSVWRGRGGR